MIGPSENAEFNPVFPQIRKSVFMPVLGQDRRMSNFGIHAIPQREIDNSENTAERNEWFRPRYCQWQ
jgi:hypothetical protein